MSASTEADGRFDRAATLPPALLVPSADNPRRTFDQGADQELLESIREHGILTPILVRPIVDTPNPKSGRSHMFHIVAGHRRWAAAEELGLANVPVVIRDLDDEQAAEIAIVENLQREELSPLDEAASYQKLLSLKDGATPAAVAATVGKSPAYVGRRLKLLQLVPNAQDALRAGRMDVARAELLTKLDPKLQDLALTEAVWMPLYSREAHGQNAEAQQTSDQLEPLADLREWVEKRIRLALPDLTADQETREMFPEAVEAAEGASAAGVTLLEIALDRFGQSPSEAAIPEGVLRLGKNFRQVIGKACKHAQTALVVFGECRGDVVKVCTAKKACESHWPKAATTKAKGAIGSGDRPVENWKVEEEKRRAQQAIYEKVRPQVAAAIATHTKGRKLSDDVLRNILSEFNRFDDGDEAVYRRILGPITLKTFAAWWAVAQTSLFTESGASAALKDLKVKFDLAKAMKEASTKVKAEIQAAAANPPSKSATKPAKKAGKR